MCALPITVETMGMSDTEVNALHFSISRIINKNVVLHA